MDNLKAYRAPIALGVLVILAGLAWYVTRPPPAPPSVAPSQASIKKIRKDRVQALEIRRPNEPTIQLAKRDGKWRVVAPVDAEADPTAVDGALDRLSQLDIVSTAATERRNHAQLEVDDAHGVRVIARGAGGSVLLELVVGAYRGGNTMVRRPSESTVYAAEGALKYAFNRPLKDWRQRTITDFESNEVTYVSFHNEHGTFSFRKDGDDWVVAEGATPVERLQSAKVASIVSSLVRLRAVDFAEPSQTAGGLGLSDQSPTATFRLGGDGGGQEITIRIGNARGEDGREVYAMRAGGSVVFVISKYIADRMRPEITAFQSPPDAGVQDGGTAAAAEPPPPMPMPMGGGGGQQIPPELMRQIQQQMQQRQQHQGE